MRSRLPWALLLAFAPLACSSTEDNGLQEADELVQSSPIEAVDWLSCWINADTSTSDPFFQSHELRCVAKTPEDYPLQVERFIVEAKTANGHVSSILEGREETTIGRLHNDAFPIELSARFTIGGLSDQGVGLMHMATIESLAAHPSTNPVVHRAPFTLWPVEITFTNNARPYVQVERYDVSVAPYTVGFNRPIPDTSTPTLSLRPPTVMINPATLLLVEPPSKSIRLSMFDQNSQVADFELRGPGNYEFDGQALRRLDGDAPVPDPSAPPVDLTPDCGGQGQVPCGPSNDRSCDEGFRVNTINGRAICTACGADGQTYCGTSDQPLCNAGTRPGRVNGLLSCIACGADGQTYCGTSDQPICNAGTRPGRVNGLLSCIACGADGQTYCGTSDQPLCNEGLRPQRANGVLTCRP